MLTKRFTKRAIAVAVVAALVPHTTIAQEQSDKTAEVEKIVVWGTTVNASSTHLIGEDIASKQADHISDLLRTIPGVDVGGAHSLNQRITIRSMGDKDLNISIDGARQNTYMYHHMGNLQIHADILQSVDIEVGNNSIINGGLGGSVKFETKQAHDLLKAGQSFGGRVQLSAGDNSGSNFSLTGYGLLTDNIDVLAYYNSVDRDNYDVGGGEIKASDGSIYPSTDGTVRGLAGDLDDALIKFGWDITGNQRVQLSYEAYQDEGNYSYRPDMGLATDLAITNSLLVPLLWPTEFSRDTLTVNYEISTGNTLLKAAAYSTTSELWRDETGYAQNPDFATWAAVVTGEAQNSGINLLGETSLDGGLSQELTYGFDYVKYDTDYVANYDGSSVRNGEKATNFALFIQDRIALTEQFSITPGVRYDSYDIESAVVDNDFSQASFALALEYRVSDDFVLSLSGTELFKGPEIGEVFVGAGTNDSANADIDAETGTNIEAAFAYQTTVSAQDKLSFGATVFKTQIDDYIYDYATPPADVGGRSWKDNIGDMTIDGIEAYVNYSNGNFTASLNYSNAESDLNAIAQYSDLEGARLDRQQGDTLSASAGFDIESIDLSLYWEVLNVDGVSQGLDLDGASLDNAKDDFTVHNLNATWTPQAVEGLTMIVGIDNLFDEYYASQSSRTGVSFHPRFGELYLQDFEPGRNIKATIAYQF